MTAQTPERLLYQGEKVAMCSEPLESYFAMRGHENQLFLSPHSALWRGYIGHWEIVDDRLYLISLEGTLLGSGVEISVATFFPDSPDRVFAHWYSGTIRILEGKLLRYFHGGYASIYERDLFLDVEQGVVVMTRVQHNSWDEEAFAEKNKKALANIPAFLKRQPD
jgi:hypothetical protein